MKRNELILRIILIWLLMAAAGLSFNMQTVVSQSKPTVTSIDFPTEIVADGEPVSGTLGFDASSADIDHAKFEVIEAVNFEDFTLELAGLLQGLASGSFEFRIGTTTPQDVTLKVALVDADGLKSEPKQFSFTAVEATDAEDRASIHITNPSVGSAIAAGESVDIEWDAGNLDPTGILQVWIRPPGGTYQLIRELPPEPGSLSWPVPADWTGIAKFWVGNLTNPDGDSTEERYEVFHEIEIRVVADRPVPSIQITHPSADDTVSPGDQVSIEWDAENLDPAGTLEVWTQSPDEDWRVIEKQDPGSGSRPWSVPDNWTGNAKLWIGNFINPDGDTDAERYEVFHVIDIQVEAEAKQSTSGLAACEEGEPVFSDDFSDPSSGWLTDSGDGFDWAYADGEYRVFITEPGFTAWSWGPFDQEFPETFCLQADVKLLSQGSLSEVGLVGLVFAGDENARSFNFLGIAPAFGTFGIGECLPCEETIAEPTFSGAINPPNEFTTLTIVKRADDVAFYIDDTLVTEAERTKNGSVGVFTRTFDEPNVNGRFDNFTIRSLP